MEATKVSEHAEFLSFTYISIALLGASVLLPGFSQSIDFNRIYQIALIFLSPACVLGGESTFSKLFHALSMLNRDHYHARFISLSDRNLTLAASIIILFLVFNTGFIHEITGTRAISLSLGFNRITESNDQEKLRFLYGAYTPEQDVLSASWLSTYMVSNWRVCADLTARYHVLLSYAGIPLEGGGTAVPFLYSVSIPSCRYIYLRYMNVIYGIEDVSGTEIFRVSAITGLVNRNRIYSNGGSEILE